jgi:hypothetical protein
LLDFQVQIICFRSKLSSLLHKYSFYIAIHEISPLLVFTAKF